VDALRFLLVNDFALSEQGIDNRLQDLEMFEERRVGLDELEEVYDGELDGDSDDMSGCRDSSQEGAHACLSGLLPES
jgi:hypothetical protein